MSEDGEWNSLGVGVVRKEVDLTPLEKQFLYAVERGDIPTVQKLLNDNANKLNFNSNCVDALGRTALAISIEYDNIEMLDVLLKGRLDLGDSLLQAINEDNVEATQMILNHEKKLQKQDITGNNSCFTPDITPIILAAQRDNYEITKILLDRGDSISKPHDIRCSCDICVTKTAEDSLNHSMSRINAYRALASPSLIALSSKDPILTAFELSWELRRLSKLENELKIEYEGLAKQCQNFAVDLLDQVRGSKELEVLLNYDKYAPVRDFGDRMALARLKLAIKYKQKKFVSHANCQQLLASIWYEGLLGFRRRHIIFKVLLTIIVSLLFPILSLIYIISPKSQAGQFMRRPFIKFICHSASYMTFLSLLILASQRIKSIISLAKEADDKSTKMIREVRGAPPTSIEWMILAYVAEGLVWAEIKQLWDQGLKSYVHDMWNILDFTTNSLYIATYTLKLVAYLKVEEEKRNNYPSAYADRKSWDAYDPTLISEGLFASANIFSCLKLIYIFTVNPHLGPLQISLGRMVIDILKFLFIALLVCFSYSCGVNQLYWYYAEVKSRECSVCEANKVNITSLLNANINKSVLGVMSLTTKFCHNSLFEIIQTLYFAIYGLVELNKFELKEKHIFTQFVGKLMFGTYLSIMTVVLINMLIAMLSSSFQKISDDADTEWKFARSRLWMSYFEEGGTVPTPFNIIPTPKTFWYLGKWMFDRLCRFSTKAKTNKWHSLKRAVKRMQERDVVYQSVIFDLVKRYVMKRQKKTSEGVTEDNVNELKQDLSSFRYELLDILRSNGMNVPKPSLNSSGNQCR
ncbi:hypothetical protein HELRODRAFT_66730 [Helobdella robusta]|uniref:Transient receptor ion channel domain-containing protein n=1 Tax=Helobdella robusta TaxID=6412 RepID=T1FYP8_HELRO|nr:hypothetical protein HELRODRAFT_66730 [Helobdella robusta]ESN98767.1 hypothetical protein HELRODRAFT_66730 [Helobdella robusta]